MTWLPYPTLPYPTLLSFCGNTYQKTAADVPCPLAGRENTIVLCSSDAGEPAIWTDGDLFVKVSAPAENSAFRWWERI